MTTLKSLSLSASVILALAGGTSAIAQAPNFPWVELETTSVGLGLAGQGGEGVLHLPNLGANCSYPLKVSGFGGGVQAGISRISASGSVIGMKKISDVTGEYSATQGEATIVAGAATTQMKNNANNVRINLVSNTRGVALGFSGQGMKLEVTDPPVNSAVQYEVGFGFNKVWVSEAAKDVLNQLVASWRCRPVNIWLFGFADNVGQEDDNMSLSANRAEGVRQYLVGAGIPGNRVFTQAMGEKDSRVPTPDQTRLRANRAVVAVIQDM